ncbi:MAG: glycosyltransferase family 4 protein [Desulfobacterales bacterium]|nr:glycosyltransferase family 4 protein [Desulfobacterales bacterium]
MRLTCFIYSLGPGGAERVMSILAGVLASRGHKVKIVTYDKGCPAFYPLHPEVTVQKLRLSGGSVVRRVNNHFRRIPTFRRVMRETRPHIVISFVDRTNVLVLMAAIGLDVSVIVSERIDPRRYDPGFPYNYLRRWVYRKAISVVVQSKAQAGWVKQMSNRVAVIPNPIQACANDRNSQARRTSIVIAAGRLVPQKGFDLLLTAFAKISEKHPEWNLVIYGDGPEQPALERQVSELNLNGKVKLSGVTARLSSPLRTAGCFVLSSRFEGFPNVLMESLACGCPVVAANCTDSISEIVRHGRNGLVIPPEDPDGLANALRLILEDVKLRRVFEENGPVSIRRFDVDSIVDHWERLFQETVL